MSDVRGLSALEDDSSGSADSDDELTRILADIAEDYHARAETESDFDVASHLIAHPEHAEAILEMVATLEFFGQCDSPSAPDRATALSAGQQLDDFRIVREIGRGGMGIVYEAQQVSLRRRVALKILLLPLLSTDLQRQRFANEAFIAAQLRHPNIVSVISIGCEGNIHYYAMEYIGGPSLADIIRQGSPSRKRLATNSEPDTDETEDLDRSKPLANSSHLTWIPEHGPDSRRWGASVALTVARALQYAHDSGVLHRDIKPSNLLFDEQGKVHLTDFGLAQHTHQSALTRTGDIVGTLRYISPEQASGNRKPIDARSDIYSLGLTLYEIAAGRPAFPETSPAQLLAQVFHDEPLPLRHVDASIPVDLETIVLRATAKDPADRYESAESLANDLERFLNRQPINAKRLSFQEVAARWFWRHRRRLLFASFYGLLLIVVLGCSTIAIFLSQLATKRALVTAEANAMHAQEAVRQYQISHRRTTQLLYVANMHAAGQAERVGDLSRLSEILHLHQQVETDHCVHGFEYDLLCERTKTASKELWTTEGALYSVCVSPDGNKIAFAGQDANVRVLDLSSGDLVCQFPTEQGEVNQVVFDQTGTRLATTGDTGTVCLWDSQTGQKRRRISAHDGQSYGVAWVPNDRGVISCGADRQIKVWPISGNSTAENVLGSHRRSVEAISLSDDGRWLVSAGSDHVASVWDTTSKRCIQAIVPGNASVNCVASSDEGMVVLGTKAGIVAAFHLDDPTQFWCAAHFDSISSVGFASDGRTVIAGDHGGVLRVWEPMDSGQLRSGTTTASPLPIAMVRPDSVQLTTKDDLADQLQKGGVAGLQRETDTQFVRTHAMRQIASWEAHLGRVYSVQSIGNGAAVSTGQDGRLVRWRFGQETMQSVSGPAEQPIRRFAMGDDGRIMTVHQNSTTIGEVADGSLVDILTSDLNSITAVQTSPSHQWLAVGGPGPAIEIWDLASSTRTCRIDVSGKGFVSKIVFSPDERLIAVVGMRTKNSVPGHEGVIRVYDVHSGKRRFAMAAADCQAMAFQPNTEPPTLVCHDRHDLLIWRLGSQPDRVADAHDNAISQIRFSRNGQLFATASHDRSAVLWDARGNRLATLVGHNDRVFAACLHPNGRTLVTGSEDGEVRLWNVATGQPLFVLRSFSSPIRQLGFSSDARNLACLLDDGTLHLLETGLSANENAAGGPK
ncbi:Serine/threonine-protein kinase PrkC [Stieleria neptunia]|uniref:non-specific serine/threonine protein kinase n=1 Tax=Stieleria neptunia TaxID=2527979 RepID=A0A518HQ46_9BACT|nr:protein kinase [Stieleria neptunia]QDV42963.1 Serine/threonine-protein kinase PrkC [Stieleria neptunia]